MEIIVLTTGSEEKSAKKLGYPTYTYLPYDKKNHDELVVIRWGNGFVSAPMHVKRASDLLLGGGCPRIIPGLLLGDVTLGVGDHSSRAVQL